MKTKRSFFGRLIKSRGGFAMESALVFLITLFSLCALITTVTLVGHRRADFENSTILSKVELEQIGEDFLTWSNDPKAEETFDIVSENYECSVVNEIGEDGAGDRSVLTVCKSNTDTVLLSIELVRADESSAWQLAKWSTLPTKK